MTTPSSDELKNILDGTSSKKIYDELNQDAKKKDYDRFCQEFKTDGSEENDDFKFCKKIARNAEHLSKMGITDAYRYRCTHYRHWVYDELYNLLKAKKESSDPKSFINKFIEAQKSIILWYGEYGCHFDFQFKDLEELKQKQEEKRLYDYFQNYSSIKTVATCNNVQAAKYKGYLSDISELYKKHKYEKQCCENVWWNNCIQYFNCHDDYNPGKLLNSLTSSGTESCDNIKENDKSLKPVEKKNSQNSEGDIMDTFHYARCKNITEDMMTCNILPINFKSPKNIYKPFLIANCDEGKCKSIPDIHLQPDKLEEIIAPVTSSGQRPPFPMGNYTISQSNGDTIIVPKNNTYRYAFTFERSIKEEDARLTEKKTKPSIKWMFGKGELNCSDDKTSPYKNELCKYVKNLKESQRKLKEQYKGSHELADIMSKFSKTIPHVNGDGSIIHSNPDENTDPEGFNSPDSDDYNIDVSEDENNIFYNIFVRIGLVAFLTLGSIFLFFVYYKVNGD
ncbi:hypothetical protein PVMG_04846 [Plasmodium vivax Mauritania I]|uniref:VIR protein n=1 Tax=Plasmodium vivax Mauritania I TaxID=1035515 RepID=A0A0J9T7K3_PLAVI|nr:hypothetical protein PVMG_04846 [Plasmodium vivax Mauritania I]